MRAVVCTDLEGIGGVDRFEDCFPSWRRRYRRAQELMEGETNAVIAGLRDAGVDDIVVTDWHFVGNNLRRERVEAPVEGLWLDGRPRMDREVYGPRDLAVFVGMHAAAGAASFMAHTFWQGLAVEVDGTPVNEAYLWSTMVAAAGARIGLVAGEAQVADECAVLLPGVPVVSVKESRSRDVARTTRSVHDIREELRQAAHDAARAVDADVAARPSFAQQPGREVRITFYEQAWADRAARRGVGEPVGPRQVATTLDRPDGLIPLAAEATMAMPAGLESSLLSRLTPPPERTGLPAPVRDAAVGCVHGLTRPLMRRGVRETQEMDQSRYPAPPGTDRHPTA